MVKKNNSLRIESDGTAIQYWNVRVRRIRQDKAFGLYSGGVRFELRPDINYPDWILLWLSSVPPDTFQKSALHYANTASLHILSCSLFTVIRPYELWVNDSDILLSIQEHPGWIWAHQAPYQIGTGPEGDHAARLVQRSGIVELCVFIAWCLINWAYGQFALP